MYTSQAAGRSIKISGETTDIHIAKGEKLIAMKLKP